jgi:hypothetical protein
MGYLSRLPNSNDPPPERSSRWLSTSDFMDETALLLAGKARRCVLCRRATDVKHLDGNRLCPDCSQSPQNWLTEKP